MEFRQVRLGGRQMVQRRSGLGKPLGRHRPVQPRPPGRDILGQTSQASVDPARRLFEGALANRQVGPPQRDPFILRRKPSGAIQEIPN